MYHTPVLRLFSFACIAAGTGAGVGARQARASVNHEGKGQTMTSQPPTNGFDEPAGDDTSRDEETAASEQFDTPPAGDTGEEQASFVPDASQTTGFATPLLDAHGAIAEALRGQARGSQARSMALEGGREGLANVEAVALGLGEPGDGPPGEPTLNVFVAERTSTDKVREIVVDGLGVQTAGDLPLTVRRSGEFEAQPHTFKIRPAPGGVSVGHYRITAGTLGCLATGRRAPRTSRLLMLSNNHVLANSNSAAFGDNILQPGRHDGGNNPADRVAILERFVPIKFGGATNYVDAATGWCWPSQVRRELIYPYGSGHGLYRIGNSPQYPALGTVVGKSGRTTQLTQGRVIATNWSGWVNYGAPGSAYFAGQSVIQATSGNFSAPGDSGSVVWKWQSGLPPVALLFAGGGGYTIASPMPWVTYFLDINLYT